MTAINGSGGGRSDGQEQDAPKRILIVLLGSIGDVVRALPLLGRLRKAYPSAHIAWAVEPKSAPVLTNHPWLDELILYDRAHALKSAVPFLRRMRAGHFDLVLDLQRIFKSGVISRLSGAPIRYGFAKANTKELNHLFSNRRIEAQPAMRLKLLQYQAFGDALGLPGGPNNFGLGPSASEREHAHELLAAAPSPRIGVILGSSWPSRIYFPEMTAAVIRELSRPDGAVPGFNAVLLGSGEESRLAGEVIGHLGGAQAINLTGRTGLRDLIAVLAECDVAFGPDSGPMHISAAVGCPVVSLWGATAPERSAPPGFADLVIRGEIPCHPCYLRKCPIGRQCMRRIDPMEVARAVRRAYQARLNTDESAGSVANAVGR